MEKLSSELSFRGWSQDHISKFMRLEQEHSELLEEVKKLKDELRARDRERVWNYGSTIKTDSRQTGDDSQSP
jgi:uncharacterized protein (UPF0335 family)